MCDTDGTHEHGSEACTCETTATGGHEHGYGHEHDHAAAHTHTHTHTPEHGVSASVVEASYGVLGMDCSHCVASVTEELGRLGGVKNVNIELVAGGVSRVTVASDATLDHDDVSAAIDEAGYELVDLPA